MFEIKEKEQLASGIFQIVVSAPRVAKKALPGQFIILRISENGERIPLTIKDSDSEAGTVTVVVQVAGKTTSQLSTLDVGDAILDFVGPLGNPTELPEGESKVVCIGGGVGTACMYPQVKELARRGSQVTVIIGARSKDLLIMEDELREFASELIVCTDDGSYGRKGFVSEPLQDMLEAGERPAGYRCAWMERILEVIGHSKSHRPVVDRLVITGFLIELPDAPVLAQDVEEGGDLVACFHQEQALVIEGERLGGALEIVLVVIAAELEDLQGGHVQVDPKLELYRPS